MKFKINKNIIYSLAMVFTIVSCTPKAGDIVQNKNDVNTTVVQQPETFRQKAPESGPPPKVQIGSYEQFQLSNGLKIIVVENHKLPRVSFQLYVDAPERLEDEKTGYADMAGDLLNKGTVSRTKSAIDEEIDFMGANLTTSSSGIFASSLTKHSENLMVILSDVLLNPTFPDSEFKKIKTQTLSALAQSKDDPNQIAANVADVLRYGKDHPYGEVVTEKTIENISLEDCKKYYQDYFKPNLSYLVVVGDITPPNAMMLAERYLGEWKSAKELEKVDWTIPEGPSKTVVDFVHKPGAVQSVINITYPIYLPPGHEDIIKAGVMNTMLGGFFQSRLMQNLRETHAYTYGARSRIDNDKLVGFFNAGASVRNEVTDSSIVEFLAELNAIRAQPIGKDDLDMVKNVIAGNFSRSLERPETIARFALNTARYKLPADYYASYLKKLDAVTTNDVMEMAKKYVRPDKAHIIVVGNKDEVAEKLDVFSHDGKLKYYDHYGNKIVPSESKIPEGVTTATILEDYLNAIGGKDKLMKVNSLSSVMKADLGGPSILMETYQKDGNKFSLTMMMNGQVMQSQVYNNGKAMASGMGQKKAIEGDELEDLKISVKMFPELFYEKFGYSPELKGMEDINGIKAYKVVVTKPNGKTFTDYFDITSSLKIRTIQSSGEIFDIGDYQEVEGVLLPYTLTLSGGQIPFPMNFKTEKMEVNGAIDDEVFKVE